MSSRRLFTVPEPLEGDESTLLVTFCIPNTRGWRHVATAAVSQIEYGRAYNERTGSILGALETGRQVFASMSMCELDQVTRAIRELTAVIGGRQVDLTEPIPDVVDFSDVEFGVLPTLHEHLQALGPIPKAGDTIMTSLQKLVEAEGYTGLTLDELSAQINGLAPGLFDRWKDYLEVLSFLSEIFPGTTRVDIVGDFWQKLSLMRYRHNDLTIKGYQATALRGIMRALAPFDEEPEADEDTILKQLGSIPWLARAAVAMAEPTPGGEAWLAASTIAQAVASFLDKIKQAWATWLDKWINQVETPTPTDNVVTAISAIAGAIGGLDLEPFGGNPNKDTGISLGLAGIAASLQSMANKCSLCGSSGGCGCGGLGSTGPVDNLPPIDDYTELDDPPVGWEVPGDAVGSPAYISRKCKMANIIHSALKFIISTLSSKTAEIAAAKSLPQALGLALMVTVVAAVLGEAVTPVPIIDSLIVAGTALSLAIAAYLLSVDLAFGPLNDAMTDREDDLICALFNASSVGQAVSLYRGVLEDEGVNSALSHLAGLLVGANFGASLFLDVAGLGELTDAALSSYVPENNCTCGGCETLIDHSFLLSESNDWAMVSFVSGDYPSSGAPSVSFASTGMTIGGVKSGPNLKAVNAEFNLPVGLEIHANNFVRMRARRASTAANYNVLFVETVESGIVVFGGWGWTSTLFTDRDYSLAALAGETLVRVGLYSNNSTSANDFYVEYESFAVICS